jgi:hypothetical protein
VLLATLVLFACPPTATPDKPDRETADERLGIATRQSGLFRNPYGNPYGDHFYDYDEGTPFEWASLPLLEHDLPELPTLPLWDLDATLAQIEAEYGKRGGPEWFVWLRWVILSAQGRPATAHSQLTSALSSDQLTAERLMWWRSLSPYDLHALLAAAGDSSGETRMYLAAALALGEWTLSCPVAVAVDGACRMPGEGFLVRREPIGVARAREWTKVANKLRRKLSIDPTDIAALALFAELDVAAMTEDYESQLVARMPHDLDYENESKARYYAFYESSQACARSLYDRHFALVRVHADLAARIHLREAAVLLTEIEDWDADTSWDRTRSRDRIEGTQYWSYGHRDDSMDLNRDRVNDLLTRCIDPTFTPDLEVIDACRILLDDLDATPTQAELVPEPQTTSKLQRHGLVAPTDL